MAPHTDAQHLLTINVQIERNSGIKGLKGQIKACIEIELDGDAQASTLEVQEAPHLKAVLLEDVWEGPCDCLSP